MARRVVEEVAEGLAVEAEMQGEVAMVHMFSTSRSRTSTSSNTLSCEKVLSLRNLSPHQIAANLNQPNPMVFQLSNLLQVQQNYRNRPLLQRRPPTATNMFRLRVWQIGLELDSQPS